MSRSQSNNVSVNCKWYFGHEVEVITYFSQVSQRWYVHVYHAEATVPSMSQDGSNNDIHQYGDSKHSLSDALRVVERQIDGRMAKLFYMESGAEFPSISEFPVSCGCKHASTIAVVNHANKIEMLEAKLLALQGELRGAGARPDRYDRTIKHDSPKTHAGSMQATLQTIESKLATIEQHIQQSVGEITAAPALPDSPLIPEATPIEVDNVQSGDTSTLVNRLFALNRDADWTPRTTTSDRSITPKPGLDDRATPDAAPELTHAILRQEINKALAAAMVGMADVLGSGVNV